MNCRLKQTNKQHLWIHIQILKNFLSEHQLIKLFFSGIKINGNIFASSSYDGSVCLWTLDGNRITVFNEPSHLLRCIGFSGNTVVSGDFGGYLHFWEIEIASPATPVEGCVKIKKYHAVPSHKSHIVCIQQNARRIVSGSRDKTVLVQDFWANVSKMRSLWSINKTLILVHGIPQPIIKLQILNFRIWSDNEETKNYLVQLTKHPISRIQNLNFPNLRCWKWSFSF